jgi:two-component system response regulator AtoC
VEYLLKKLSFRMGRSLPALAPAAVEKLREYPFPGNVRELENVLERALIYREDGAITPGDIDLHRPGSGGLPGESAPGLPSLETVEREAIRKALDRTKGNRTRAAAELGISRKTIINKIKAYGL